MSTQASTISIASVRRLPIAAKLNVIGLVLASAGMLVQIAAGSTLYPTITGPIVLIGAAILVAFGPARRTRWVGLVVPLVLGLGGIVGAVMTGGFIDQLTGVGMPGLFAGSLMHMVGLIAAVAGGGAMILGRPGTAPRDG